MRFLTCFTTFALVGLLTAAPQPKDDTLIITQDYFPDAFVKYTSKYDIVNILVPLNDLNFKQSPIDDSDFEDLELIVFFVEAEIQPDGTPEYKGLYVLKGDKVTKLLDNGRAAAASGDDSLLAFFGASDGIYVYNQKTNSAEKYGSVTDSVIGIAKEVTGDVLYILTENKEVYKVSDNGEKKEKLEDVEEARQIVLDYNNNLYFYSDDNKPYVRTAEGVEPIQGLPENLSHVKLVKAPAVLETGVGFLADNKLYLIYDNETSESTGIVISPDLKITASAPEATLIHYYAIDKKLYEFNIFKIYQQAVNEELDNYLVSKGTSRNAIASGNHSKSNKRVWILRSTDKN